MVEKRERKVLSTKELASLAGERAANLYHVHGLCCSEAILLVLARGFGGDMSEEIAISVGSGLCGGMGGGEGVCGALSGAVVALGGHLGPNLKTGLTKKKMRKIASCLHDSFKEKYGSTCCKELTVEYTGNKRAKLKNCGKITADTAEMAVEILLQEKSSLVQKADRNFLQKRDTKVSRLLNKVVGR